MSIKVYYSCLEEEWLRFNQPVNVLKKFTESKTFDQTGIYGCPAFRDASKNIFGLQSIYDYSFTLHEDRIESNFYDQAFFDRHVHIRSLPERTFSFTQWVSLFTDEDTLNITANIIPYLENNDISTRCLMPPGKFDLAKWFRNIEFVFQLRPNFNEFKINEGDVYEYIQFHTDQKIEFIPYKHDEEMASFMEDIIKVRNFSKPRRSLTKYYDFYKTKKLISKKIKEKVLI